VDFEFPNENGEPYKSSGGEMADSELGEIPKGWTVEKIAKRFEVSDFVANGSFASLKENVNILEMPSYALFLRNTDSKSNFTNQMRYVDENTYNFLAKSKLIGNEICISNVADVGTVFRPPTYLNMPMTLGNNLILFRSDSPNYFYFYFKYFNGQNQIQSITSGSAQLKFNKTDFRNLPIIEVPKSYLVQFESLINDFSKMQFNALSENVQLTKLRETLLPRLISGELQIIEN
jgi:type I restriction enzyme S subunit